MAVFNAKLCTTDDPPILDHLRSYLHENSDININYLRLSREDDTIRESHLIFFVTMQCCCGFYN